MKRKGERGLTLVELIVAFTIMAMLTAMAVPLARYKVRRDKERELVRHDYDYRTTASGFRLPQVRGTTA